VITGVQAVLKATKILDSGFRQNDGKKTEPDFFTPSPSEGERQGGGAKGTRGEVL